MNEKTCRDCALYERQKIHYNYGFCGIDGEGVSEGKQACHMFKPGETKMTEKTVRCEILRDLGNLEKIKIEELSNQELLLSWEVSWSFWHKCAEEQKKRGEIKEETRCKN